MILHENRSDLGCSKLGRQQIHRVLSYLGLQELLFFAAKIERL
jgi:hypothetical protein